MGLSRPHLPQDPRHGVSSFASHQGVLAHIGLLGTPFYYPVKGLGSKTLQPPDVCWLFSPPSLPCFFFALCASQDPTLDT